MISTKVMGAPQTRPNIFEFLDYRDFVLKMFEYLKSHQRGFSHRNFSRHAGFRSSGVLTNVIRGRKALSLTGAKKTARGLRLNTAESEYLVDLVAWTHEVSPDKKSQLLAQLISKQGFHQMNPLKAAQLQYFSDIRMPVIRELILAGCTRRDEILKRLRFELSASELEEILAQLLVLQMIEETQGELGVVEKQAHTDAECPSPIVKDFHRKMICEGLTALETVDRSLRDIQALTLSLPSEEIPAFKRELNSFLTSLSARFERVSAKHRIVYQLNLQAFPFSK